MGVACKRWMMHQSIPHTFIHLNPPPLLSFLQGNKNQKQARAKWVQPHGRKGGAATTEEAASATAAPRTNGAASPSAPQAAAAEAGASKKKAQAQQQQKGGGGGRKSNAAAEHREQQALAALRGQSILGSATATGRFSNSIPTGAASSSSSSSENTSSSSSSSSTSKTDMATFQRFSNIGERLAKARGANTTPTPYTNGQQQQGRHQHQPQQQRRGGGGGGHHRQQQQQPQGNARHQQPPPHTNGGGGGAAFPGFAAAGASRWAAPVGAASMPNTTAEPGQVRLWDVELSDRVAPTRVPFPSREERHIQQQQQTQQLKQQQQQRRRGGQGGSGPRRRLDKRLRVLQRVPLVLPHEPLSVRDLSQKLAMKMKDVSKRLVRLGGREEYGALTPDSLVDLDVAELLGLEMGRTVKRMEPAENLLEYKSRSRESRPDWPLRAPVVCVMGHVDHGKTTLLDALRRSKMAAGEAGGITQRLGAFHIPTIGGSSSPLGVTVLDTPGHAAFSAMRVHGALATDIVLLVISATDGIQEQTEEVLRLVAEQQQSQQVALMVAVTKVDKLGGSEEDVAEALSKIDHALAAHGVMTESMGGEVQVVPVSAPTGKGLSDLTERLQLQAEVLELRADRKAPGEGLVLDAYVDKGLGVVMNVLVRWGALAPGDVVVAGDQYGRVKKIMDDSGKDAAVEAGLPSMPVRVLGFKELPSPGEDLIVVKSEERAQAVAEARRAAKEQQRYEEMEETDMMDEEDQEQLREILDKNLVGANSAGKKTKAFLALQRGAMEDVLESSSTNTGVDKPTGPVVVPFLVKADGKGTLDAVTAALAAYQSEVIRAEVIGMGCGAVTEGDVERAKAAAAREVDGGGEPCTILAFGVGFANAEVGEVARRDGVAVRRQQVIYSLLDDVKETLQKHMPMERIESPVGKLEVQATFSLTGRRRTRNLVAGCKVLSGAAFSASQYRYRVTRGGEVVCDESPPATLFHFKEQVQEVKKGQECGLSLEGWGEYEAGDVIECYTVAHKPKKLSDVFRY